jgi:hypothetical protein
VVEAAVQRSTPLARLTPMGTPVLLEGMDAPDEKTIGNANEQTSDV